jgi:hypothetical protein
MFKDYQISDLRKQFIYGTYIFTDIYIAQEGSIDRFNFLCC